MRGKKSGLEKRLQDKAPQLLNVDGDCCHHVHNSIKVFCQPFDNLVEKFIDDVHIDSKWSTDVRDALKEICFLLNIPFRMPPLRISHRWLSLYDCLSVNMSMFDAFALLYYSWVPDNEKHLFKEDICLLYKKYDLNEGTINIKSFNAKFKVKSLTKEGQERKERLMSKLFHQKPKFQLTAYFFLSVLPLFKTLVLILEQKEPLIHRIHSMLCENLKIFFPCYVKFQLLTSLNLKDLKSIDAKK